MKESGDIPQPAETDSEVKRVPFWRRGKFLAADTWRRVIGNEAPDYDEADDDTEEDDDDTETGKKSRRFGRLWQRLFPKLGSKEEIKPDERRPAPVSSLGELFARREEVAEEEPEADDDTSEAEPTTVTQAETPQYQGIELPAIGAYEAQEPSVPEQPVLEYEDLPHESAETFRPVEEEPAPEAEPVQAEQPLEAEPEPNAHETPTEPVGARAELPPEPPRDEGLLVIDHGDRSRRMMGGGVDFVEPASSTTPVVERIYERDHTGLGPALVVDQLSRHRDRKLKRTDRELRRDLKSVDRRQKGTESELQTVTRSQQEQNALLRAQQRSLEGRIEARMAAQERAQQAAENVSEVPLRAPEATKRTMEPQAIYTRSESAPQIAPVTTPELMPERPFVVPFPIPESRTEKPEATPAEYPVPFGPEKGELSPLTVQAPEKVLERVTAAADKDAPIELGYERRAEIRDDSAMPMGATSVGTILAGSGRFDQSSMVDPTTGSQQSIGWLDPVRNKVRETADDAMYRQAVSGGFWTAVLIIAVALVIKLVG